MTTNEVYACNPLILDENSRTDTYIWHIKIGENKRMVDYHKQLGVTEFTMRTHTMDRESS